MSIDLLVFLVVLALRLLVPLAIPYVPLPAIVAALVIDGVDQTVFQTVTDLDLTGYQGYDKALDVYYLTIAYLATIRNWTNLPAFDVSRFLLYYRLVGVLLFELLNARALLLIFPNTFEYFFIFYEVVRLRWDPARMPRRVVYGAAALIWIVIKLPQEWWIHVAKLDLTDELGKRPWAIPVLVAVGAVVVAVAWWVVARRLPAADHRPVLGYGRSVAPVWPARVARTPILRLLDWVLVEKIVLVSLVCAIFAQIIPEVETGPLEMTVVVGFVITSNAIVSELLIRRGVSWSTTAKQFVSMAAINAGLVIAGNYLLPTSDGEIDLGSSLFFLLLLTLLVTLFDRFRPEHVARVSEQASRRFGLSETGRMAVAGADGSHRR